jgi:hypothetical protein
MQWIRFGSVLLALIFIYMSSVSWRFGDPPTWTMFLPSKEAMVLSSTTSTYRIGNGTMRTDPVIEVEWPGAETGRALLLGVTPTFYWHGRSEAERLAAAYPAGSPTRIRVWNDQPYAARIDLFKTAHAVFMTFMTLVLSLIAFVLFLALKP